MNVTLSYLHPELAKYRQRWLGYAGITKEGLLMQWALGPTGGSRWNVPVIASTPTVPEMHLVGCWFRHPETSDWDVAILRAGDMDAAKARIRDLWDFGDAG